MKPPLVKRLNLQLNGVSSSLRMANLFVLAAELNHLHKDHNYHLRGPQLKAEAETKRPTWPRYCVMTAGLSEGTVRNYLECWNVLVFRLHYDSRPEAKAILQLMTQRPSDLSDDDRQKMIQGIATLALKETDTPDTLKKENRQPRKAQSDEIEAAPVVKNEMGDARPVKHYETPESLELLALACGVSPETAQRVARLILVKRYKDSLGRVAINGLKKSAKDVDFGN